VSFRNGKNLIFGATHRKIRRTWSYCSPWMRMKLIFYSNIHGKSEETQASRKYPVSVFQASFLRFPSLSRPPSNPAQPLLRYRGAPNEDFLPFFMHRSPHKRRRWPASQSAANQNAASQSTASSRAALATAGVGYTGIVPGDAIGNSIRLGRRHERTAVSREPETGRTGAVGV
jgi:hypothetical protein